MTLLKVLCTSRNTHYNLIDLLTFFLEIVDVRSKSVL